ncbi:unnamed protein product, partial [Rotaria sp. Silwood2]
LSDPALARLPTRDNIKRRIKKLRQEKDIIQAPNDLNFPVVPVQLTKTFRQNQFLRCDTGSVVPEIFYQLYIIYSVYRNHVIPVIYALLRRKGAETYKCLITEILKFTPCWLLQTLMLDFEQACVKVYQTSFSTVLLDCLRRNNIRRKPLFDIDFWNMYHGTTQASMRTNNATEAYHRRIGSVFQCAHPT